MLQTAVKRPVLATLTPEKTTLSMPMPGTAYPKLLTHPAYCLPVLPFTEVRQLASLYISKRSAADLCDRDPVQCQLLQHLTHTMEVCLQALATFTRCRLSQHKWS